MSWICIMLLIYWWSLKMIFRITTYKRRQDCSNCKSLGCYIQLIKKSKQRWYIYAKQLTGHTTTWCMEWLHIRPILRNGHWCGMEQFSDRIHIFEDWRVSDKKKETRGWHCPMSCIVLDNWKLTFDGRDFQILHIYRCYILLISHRKCLPLMYNHVWNTTQWFM